MTVEIQERLFLSMFDLRAAHHDLMQQQQEHDSVVPISGAVESFIRRTRDSGRLLYAEEQRAFAQAVIDYWTAALYREARVEVRQSTLAPFDSALAPDLPKENCPYIGLQPFDEEHSGVFFGRTQLLEAITARLRTHRFITIIGQSGTGKSSLVTAGLVPMLKRGVIQGSENWQCLPRIVPGADPLAGLARLLKPADFVMTDEWAQTHERSFLASPTHLLESLNRLGRPALVFVDQFEELFTLCGDNVVRNAFAGNLARVATAPGQEHRVIITVRSDYETQLVQLRDIESLFRDGEIRVGAMNASELRDAIEGPAQKVGLLFDNGLVQMLIDDTLGESGALPLLQFTLRTLWDEKERNRLSIAAYTKLGGALLALGSKADEVYDAWSVDTQNAAKRMFLRLVRPGQGVETVSRRISKQELFEGEVRERAEEVLQALLSAHLVRVTEGATGKDTYVEIAHEALVRNWTQLRTWIDQRQIDLIKRDRLQAAAEEWQERGRAAALLDEAQVVDAERWLDTAEARDLGVSPFVKEYVRASRKQIDRFAALERARRHRALSLVIVAGALLVGILSIAWLLAWERGNVATERARAATAEQNAQRQAFAEYKRLVEASPDKQLAELKARFVTPLESQLADERSQLTQAEQERAALQIEKTTLEGRVATLEAQLAESKGMLATAVKNATTQAQILDQARRDLESAQRDLTVKNRDLDRFQARVASLEAQLEIARRQPDTPTIDVLPSTLKLKVGGTIRSSRPGGSVGVICCFFKPMTFATERFFVAAARTVSGETGDLVLHTAADGKQYRVGAIWKVVGSGTKGAVIVRVLPGVEFDPEFPGGRVSGTEDDVEDGQNIRVLLSDGKSVGGQVVTDTPEAFSIAAPGDSSMYGAPVVNASDELIGIVVGTESLAIHVMPIETVRMSMRKLIDGRVSLEY